MMWLSGFMSWIFRADKNGDGMKGYLDNVDTVEGNLKDAGCDETLVKEFIKLIKTGERKRQLRMLEKHRSNLLEEIHKNEKKIECLDYLVCQMEKKMGKKIVVLSTSPRMGGNSEMMADAFIRGAAEAGHEAEKIHLYDKKIEFCKGCLACQHTGACVIRDDAAVIVEQMRQADVLVFATPIYFYEMSGQMKTLLDRTNPLFPGEYAFRDIYLLAASADEEASSMDGAVKGLEGWISCFEQAHLSGVIRGAGADKKGEIENVPEALNAAYEFGRNV
ncbi:flavodoxin family protein [Hungatella sp.]|uniref:flavodoxin family protein n=1 Tax=Hungatella sp. TaxID=2613924 RepID=UPI0032E472A3